MTYFGENWPRKPEDVVSFGLQGGQGMPIQEVWHEAGDWVAIGTQVFPTKNLTKEQVEALIDRSFKFHREQKELDRRLRELETERFKSFYPPETIQVDLAAEGKAIATILEAVNVLPDHSHARVLEAVGNLILSNGLTPVATDPITEAKIKIADEYGESLGALAQVSMTPDEEV